MVDYLVTHLLYNERFERQAVGSAIIYTIFQEDTTLRKYSLSYHPVVGLSLVAQKTIFEHVLNTRGRDKVNWSTQQIDQVERIYTIDDRIYRMMRYLADHNPEATQAKTAEASASDKHHVSSKTPLLDTSISLSSVVVANTSGGINLKSDETDIDGDVIGRDKIESAGGHIIHAGPGSLVIVVDGKPMNTPPFVLDKPEVKSIQHQLADARENLRLIEERKTQYVQEVDIPLQLIRDERHLIERIAELEKKLSSH